MQNILFSQRQIEFEKLCKSEAVKIKNKALVYLQLKILNDKK